MSTITKYGMPVKYQVKMMNRTPMLKDYGFIPYPQDRGHIFGDYKGENFKFHRYKSWAERYWNDDIGDGYSEEVDTSEWDMYYEIKDYNPKRQWYCYYICHHYSINWESYPHLYKIAERSYNGDLKVPVDCGGYVIFRGDSFKIDAYRLRESDEFCDYYDSCKGFDNVIDALKWIRKELN